MSNQMRSDPEQRLEDYLKRCVDAHYEERGEEQRNRDLGITEDVEVYDPALTVLRRIEEREKADMIEA